MELSIGGNMYTWVYVYSYVPHSSISVSDSLVYNIDPIRSYGLVTLQLPKFLQVRSVMFTGQCNQ
jgi:hypothetical protein